MAESVATVEIRCAKCTAVRKTKLTAKGEARIPNGWHRHPDGTILDGVCWSKQYILRAISLPVASPLDCSWAELRPVLKDMWAQTTNCANRIMTELYVRDVRRNGQPEMPPMPRVYLYPELRREFPGLPARSVASLEQSCQRKYRALRYEIVWTGQATLPTHRYPTPFPIPNQGWMVSIEQERAIVSVRIGDQRIRLLLKTGPQFRRQYSQIRQIVRGEAVCGAAAIYERGLTLMMKLVAWLPRQESNAAEGTLAVRTDPECLLVAVNARDERIWRYNGDHLRRWGAEHREQLQRWAEDAKYENRPVPAFAERRATAVTKYNNRMSSAVHEIAAQLAGYAARRRVALVRFDVSDRSFLGNGFPWARLRDLVHEKLDAKGIAIEFADGPIPERPSEPFAGDGRNGE